MDSIMKASAYFLLLLFFLSCTDTSQDKCHWVATENTYLNRTLNGLLDAYDAIAERGITGKINWHQLGPYSFLELDIWNLYDTGLIGECCILNENTILVTAYGNPSACNEVYSFQTINQYQSDSTCKRISEHWTLHYNPIKFDDICLN